MKTPMREVSNREEGRELGNPDSAAVKRTVLLGELEIQTRAA
jgi:hypothetical protein